jgi:hypothetical protein
MLFRLRRDPLVCAGPTGLAIFHPIAKVGSADGSGRVKLFSAVMAMSRPIHGCLPPLLALPGMRRGSGEEVDAYDQRGNGGEDWQSDEETMFPGK